VAAKATRDALFLTSLDITALPTMLMATAGCSILLVVAHARVAQRVAPRALVPALFAFSGALFLAEWLYRPTAPGITALLTYLHVSIAGPLLTSGFWLIASESFNPRTAKKGYGRIAAAGTLGGFAGALFAERVAAMLGVPSMLLILGVLQCVTAWTVRRLAVATSGTALPARDAVPVAWSSGRRSGLRVIAAAPQFQVLVILLLLGTMSGTLLDYLFKASAVETFGPGDGLLRFFALYYAATSVISFVLQTVASRAVLERFGLALATSAPSIALLAGTLASIVAPGLGSLVVARGGECVFRTSWFRAGYELFYTPIPSAEKRSAKSLIDVGVERLGDGLGGALVTLIALHAPGSPVSMMLTAAVISSVGAIVAASHLNRWYVRTLERSLVDRGSGIDFSSAADDATANVVLRVRSYRAADTSFTGAETTLGTGAETSAHTSLETEPATADEGQTLKNIRFLRSTSPDDIKRLKSVLSRDECLEAALVPHVIPFLAVDDVADHAAFALRKIAEERVGVLADALLDRNQDAVVRRRLAQVFSVCVSQRAADTLLLALDDERFDVRFQAARSLAAVVDKNPRVRFDRERILDVILREVAAGRPVWESRRLLDASLTATPLDAFVRDRASQSLAQVFTLLSLVLPREPLQIAFRSLQGYDKHLRGTALEYLESVLPSSVRPQLWPYLVYQPVKPASANATAGKRDNAVADLLRSSKSHTLYGVAEAWDRQAVAGFETV
jgi:hypothetical protein